MNDKRLTVAIVDDCSQYSFNLIHEGLRLVNVNTLFYAPKKPLKNKFYPNNDFKRVDSLRIWSPLLFPLQILRRINVDRPSIVHFQHEVNTFGPIRNNLTFLILLLFLKIIRVPTVITEHSIMEAKDLCNKKRNIANISVHFCLRLFFKTISGLSDNLIVHNEEFKRKLEKTYDVDGKKVAVIPHGISSETSGPKVECKCFDNILDGKRIILYFGFLSPRKGIEYLLQAFKLVKHAYGDCVLIIAGDSPIQFEAYKTSLKALSQKLDVDKDMLFTGFIKNESVEYLFSKATVFVLPYVFSSSASGPLSTAMQNGLPIVATKTRYFENILEDKKDALLVPPLSTEALATAIVNLLKDDFLRMTLSKNIRKKAKSSNWQFIGKETAKLYYAVIAKPRSCTRITPRLIFRLPDYCSTACEYA